MNKLEELKQHDRPEFSTQWWLDRIAALEAAVADGIPDDVLSIPELLAGGVTTNHWQATEKIIKELHLEEPITDTDASHIYHLEKMGVYDGLDGSLVEWGGGFGNYAKLTQQMASRPDHVIIDLPIMILIQQQYLSWNMDDGNVSWAPNGLAADVIRINHSPVDTFMGLWSVSECTRECHDYLIDDVDWFGARNVFLAMEPDKGIFPESTGLYDRLLGLGFQEEESYYDDSVYMRLTR